MSLSFEQVDLFRLTELSMVAVGQLQDLLILSLRVGKLKQIAKL